MGILLTPLHGNTNSLFIEQTRLRKGGLGGRPAQFGAGRCSVEKSE